MTQLTDINVMRMVLSGRVELFDELVKRHRPTLLRAANNKLRNSTLAEDAVQDAFLAAYAHRHTFNDNFSVRGWLWTILLNTCRTLMAREKRRTESFARFRPDLEEPITNETALSMLLKDEQAELLANLLAQLPETEADALRMRFFGGLQFHEIAQASEISLGGAKKRVRRGLERLAKLLRDFERPSAMGSETEYKGKQAPPGEER